MKPIAVFIGRFQPLHYGHQAIIEHLKSLGYPVLVLIGEAETTSNKNPIDTYDIYRQLSKYDVTRTILDDAATNEEWVKNIDFLCQNTDSKAEFYLVIHNKPSEAGKYGLPSGQFISDYILANSTKITGSIDLSSMETPPINATDIRNSMSELLKLAPKSSLQTLLEAL